MDPDRPSGACESRYRGWCTRCGDAVDLREWHPMAAPEWAEDGLYTFCSSGCRAEWLELAGE